MVKKKKQFCERCGTEIIGRPRGTHYCVACSVIVTKEKQKEWHRRVRAGEHKPKKKEEFGELHKCHTPGCTNMTTQYWCDTCRTLRAEKYKDVTETAGVTIWND